MKCAVLISGGKDSTLAAYEAEAQGHQLVCLAAAAPAPAHAGGADVASPMFQTAGSLALPALAHCAQLPLIRCANLPASQEARDNDDQRESEAASDKALSALVSECANLYDAEAIVSGAVLSEYQRKRIERACTSVGLASIAPLWQREQSKLLDDVHAAGIECVFCRVASLGLYPSTHLGLTLHELQHHLKLLQSKYGVHAAGEGGEYETLALDSHGPLHRFGRLQLDQPQAIHAGPEDGYLWIADVTYMPKMTGKTQISASFCNTADTNPWVVDITPEGGDGHVHDTNEATAGSPNAVADLQKGGILLKSTLRRISSEDASITAGYLATSSSLDFASDQSLFHQSKAALLTLEAELHAHGFHWSDCYTVGVFVSDIAEFGSVNAAYKDIVPQAENVAPSRACIETLLADAQFDRPLFVDAYVAKIMQTNDAYASPIQSNLHVASISKWAPACIGPYAQSKTIGSLCVLAGTIGLQPFSMQLVQSFSSGLSQPYIECDMALQHCSAIAHASGFNFINDCMHIYMFMAESEPGWVASAALQAVQNFFLSGSFKGSIPPRPITIAGVSSLPRGACVELQPILQSQASSASTQQECLQVAYDDECNEDGHRSFATQECYAADVHHARVKAAIPVHHLRSAMLDDIVNSGDTSTPQNVLVPRYQQQLTFATLPENVKQTDGRERAVQLKH